jgi:hypothetical protein
MKTIGIVAMILAAATVGSATEVEPGDSLREVRDTLGNPRGQVRLGERHLLYYERGEVELARGEVTRVAMLSAEEHAALVAREERLRGDRERRRQELTAEGEALRDRKLADVVFARAPAAYQVAFWEDFSRRYPGVSVAEPLAIARSSLREQREAERKQDEATARIVELEERLAAAEQAPEFYPVATYGGYYHRRHYRPFNLGPFEYTFFPSPLPPYSTPSGNPAGDLHGPVINFPTTNPALPRMNDGHGGWRGEDRRGAGGEHRRRPRWDRM